MFCTHDVCPGNVVTIGSSWSSRKSKTLTAPSAKPAKKASEKLLRPDTRAVTGLSDCVSMSCHTRISDARRSGNITCRSLHLSLSIPCLDDTRITTDEESTRSGFPFAYKPRAPFHRYKFKTTESADKLDWPLFESRVVVAEETYNAIICIPCQSSHLDRKHNTPEPVRMMPPTS